MRPTRQRTRSRPRSRAPKVSRLCPFIRPSLFLVPASLPLSVTKTVTYDAIGNITNKSDVGNYSYDPARIHAVAAIAPGSTGTLTASYTYYGDGNMLIGKGRTIDWTSFDMVRLITQGATWVEFAYDSEHARLKDEFVGSEWTS